MDPNSEDEYFDRMMRERNLKLKDVLAFYPDMLKCQDEQEIKRLFDTIATKKYHKEKGVLPSRDEDTPPLSNEEVYLKQFKKYDQVGDSTERKYQEKKREDEHNENWEIESEMLRSKILYEREPRSGATSKFEALERQLLNEESSSVPHKSTAADNSIFKQGMWDGTATSDMEYQTPSSILPQNYHAMLLSTNSSFMDNRRFYFPETSINLLENQVDERNKDDYTVMGRKRMMQAQKLIKRTWEKKMKEKLIRDVGGKLPKSLNPDLYNPRFFKRTMAKDIADKKHPLNPIYGGNIEQQIKKQMEDVHSFEQEMGYEGSFFDHFITDTSLDREIREKDPKDLTKKEKDYLEKRKHLRKEVLKPKFDLIDELPQEIEKGRKLKEDEYIFKEKLKDELEFPIKEEPKKTRSEREREEQSLQRKHEDLISDYSRSASQFGYKPRAPTPSGKSHDTFRTSISRETEPYQRAKMLTRMKDPDWDQSLTSLLHRHSDWDPSGTTEDYLGFDPQELYLQGYQPDKFIRAAYRNSIDEEWVRKDAERSLQEESRDDTYPYYFYQMIGEAQSRPEKDTLMGKIAPSNLDPTTIFHKWADSEEYHNTHSWDDMKLGRYAMKQSDWSSENDSRYLYEPIQKHLYRNDELARKKFEHEHVRKKRWKRDRLLEEREHKHKKREQRREEGEEVSTTTPLPSSSYFEPRRSSQTTTSYLEQFQDSSEKTAYSDPRYQFEGFPTNSDQYPFPQRREDDLPEDHHLRPKNRNRLQAYWAQAVMRPPAAMEYPLYAFPENRYNVFPMNQAIPKLKHEVEYLQKRYDKTFWRDQQLDRLDMDEDDANSEFDLYQEWHKIPIATIMRHDFWELREKQAIVKPRGIFDLIYLLYDFLWQRKYHGDLKEYLMYPFEWAQSNGIYKGLFQPVITSAPYVIWGSLQLCKLFSTGGRNFGPIALPDLFLPIPSISIAPYDLLWNNAVDGMRWWADYDEYDDDFILDEALDFDLQMDPPFAMEDPNEKWGGFPIQTMRQHSPWSTPDEDYYVGEPYDRDYWGGFDTDQWNENITVPNFLKVQTVTPSGPAEWWRND